MDDQPVTNRWALGPLKGTTDGAFHTACAPEGPNWWSDDALRRAYDLPDDSEAWRDA